MCARYTMSTSAEELVVEFEAMLAADEIPARYNIAPTDQAPIVVEKKDGSRRLGMARFGLVPHWAKDPKVGARMLNARVETASEKSAYKRPLSRHRCLVIADGYYEWRRDGKARIPFLFRTEDARPFAMAGMFAVWHDPKDPDGAPMSSFTILTREAVGAVSPIHDRMPVLLRREVYARWLDRSELDPAHALALLEDHRGLELRATQVSQRVNSVKNDDPSLVEPVLRDAK